MINWDIRVILDDSFDVGVADIVVEGTKQSVRAANHNGGFDSMEVSDGSGCICTEETSNKASANEEIPPITTQISVLRMHFLLIL